MPYIGRPVLCVSRVSQVALYGFRDDNKSPRTGASGGNTRSESMCLVSSVIRLPYSVQSPNLALCMVRAVSVQVRVNLDRRRSGCSAAHTAECLQSPIPVFYGFREKPNQYDSRVALSRVRCWHYTDSASNLDGSGMRSRLILMFHSMLRASFLRKVRIPLRSKIALRGFQDCTVYGISG